MVCRRRAPIEWGEKFTAGPILPTYYRKGFPSVEAQDFCGEHDPEEVGDDVKF